MWHKPRPNIVHQSVWIWFFIKLRIENWVYLGLMMAWFFARRAPKNSNKYDFGQQIHNGVGPLHCHTVSFDWFLSCLEWVLNLEFCLLKILIFYQELLWNISSRLISPTFWVFEPVYMFDQNWSFCTKYEDFDQIYVNTGSKTQNVEELSLDLIFHNNFW